MIFNRNLLFLHPPKTAGMSTSLYLLQVLPAPVYVSQPVWDETLPAGVVHLVGKRHETLAECREVVARQRFDLRRFPIVLATIRNPYDLEVSRWAFLRQAHPWERGPEQDLALACDFDEFAVRNECPSSKALRARAGFRNGGFGSSGFEAKQPACGGASGDLRASVV